MEAFSGGADRFRGDDGPLNVTSPKFSNPLNHVFLTAAVEAGYPLSSDTNGLQQEGFCAMDQTIHKGRRVSASSAYLTPVRGRRNLTIKTNAIASRVRSDGMTAIGLGHP